VSCPTKGGGAHCKRKKPHQQLQPPQSKRVVQAVKIQGGKVRANPSRIGSKQEEKRAWGWGVGGWVGVVCFCGWVVFVFFLLCFGLVFGFWGVVLGRLGLGWHFPSPSAESSEKTNGLHPTRGPSLSPPPAPESRAPTTKRYDLEPFNATSPSPKRPIISLAADRPGVEGKLPFKKKRRDLTSSVPTIARTTAVGSRERQFKKTHQKTHATYALRGVASATSGNTGGTPGSNTCRGWNSRDGEGVLTSNRQKDRV